MSNQVNTRTGANRTQYLASLRSKVLEITSPKNYQNDDFWKPEVDKSGTGSAIFRFLPSRPNEAFPFVQVWTHGFQGPTGKWFIENCPSSLGGLPSDVCPACAGNTALWNASNDKDDPRKKTASLRKRKLGYTSNIRVVNDPKHPENNGKVFKYRYGKKIFEKIKDLLIPPPEFADMASCDAFDMVEGANFKLRIIRQDNFPNYDKSSFDPPSAISEADIELIETQLFSLDEILDPKNFKSFDELNKKYIQVVGIDESDIPTPPDADDNDLPIAKPKTVRTVTAKAAGKTTNPKTTPGDVPTGEVDDDYFSRLAQQTSEDFG